jgi:hypothetical protein
MNTVKSWVEYNFFLSSIWCVSGRSDLRVSQVQAAVSTRELVLFLPCHFLKDELESEEEDTTCNLIQPYLRHIPPPPIRFPSGLLVFFFTW